MGERPDQHHTGDGHAKPIPEAKCGAGEQVQRMPERGPLRRRPNQQFPIDRDPRSTPCRYSHCACGPGRRATVVGRWTRGARTERR